MSNRIVSTTTMIKQLCGCLGTGDLNDWESDFVENLEERLTAGQVTKLTEAQLESLTRLYKKHFS